MSIPKKNYASYFLKPNKVDFACYIVTKYNNLRVTNKPITCYNINSHNQKY